MLFRSISITKPNTRGQEIRYITISADNGEILFDKMLSSEKDFNDTATTEIYTLSLHDALPISAPLSALMVIYLISCPLVLGFVILII